MGNPGLIGFLTGSAFALVGFVGSLAFTQATSHQKEIQIDGLAFHYPEYSYFAREILTDEKFLKRICKRFDGIKTQKDSKVHGVRLLKSLYHYEPASTWSIPELGQRTQALLFAMSVQDTAITNYCPEHVKFYSERNLYEKVLAFPEKIERALYTDWKDLED